MLKKISVGLLVTVGCVACALFIVAHWMERQILTTDNWVAVVEPLPQNPAVSSALGGYISTQLFANVPIEQEIADALPPRAAFLAAPLSDQLQELTKKTTTRVVSSDAFGTVWVAANRVALTKALATARGQSSGSEGAGHQKFNINISDVRSQLRSKLQGVSSAVPSLQTSTTSNPITLSADLQSKPHQIRQLVRSVDFLSAMLFFVAVACFVWAVALSAGRRRLVAIILLILIVVVLIDLILVKVLRQEVLNNIKNAGYRPAVGYIYDSLLALLRHMLTNGLIVLLIAFVVWFLSGPAKWARKFRDFVGIGRLKNSRLSKWWQSARKLALQYRYYIWLGLALLTLVFLAFAPTINWRLIINSALVAVTLSGLVYLMAYPRLISKHKKEQA